MLRWIRIRNVAVIETLEVDFAPGLNLLTGETGAGKSILIDALGLVLGARASSELIRTGASSAVVEAGFELEEKPELLFRRLEGAGVEPDDELVIRREVAAGGRGKAVVNGVAAVRRLLRDLAPYLVDIHGQGEHLSLLRAEAGLELLDRLGDNVELRKRVGRAFRDHRALEQELGNLERRGEEREARRRELEFQLRELDEAAPRMGEDDELIEERNLLAHAEKLRSLSETAYASLYDDEGAVLTRLAGVFKDVHELAAIDSHWESYREMRDDILSRLEDLALYARDYAEKIDVTPGRLDAIEQRLAVLERLKRKYGGSLDAAIRHRERCRRELEELDASGDRAGELRESLERSRRQFRELAEALSKARRKEARRLERLVARELPALALPNASFAIEVVTLSKGTSPSEWKESGIDTAELMFSANPGEELRSLSRTASGGELARFMLALKSVSARGEPSKTLIFDEVDAGIGGRVADAVGEKLKELARDHQVICVTHLPQIASFADAHFRIDKIEEKGRTGTRIERLDQDGRVDEVARMLAGAVVTDTARKHAKQLVASKR